MTTFRIVSICNSSLSLVGGEEEIWRGAIRGNYMKRSDNDSNLESDQLQSSEPIKKTVSIWQVENLTVDK